MSLATIPGRVKLPEDVCKVLDEFVEQLGVELIVWGPKERGRAPLYPGAGATEAPADGQESIARFLSPREGPDVELEIRGPADVVTDSLACLIHANVQRAYDFALEIRFFTYELSERYEEINLLYSISETLGSVLHLDEAARNILEEVCDVLGARRGSLWVFEAEENTLRLTASVGDKGVPGPIHVDDTEAVTAAVFRDGRPLITAPGDESPARIKGEHPGEESVLSVPIQYTPPAGSSRKVGVINLIGRRHGGHFTASDQKLLAAIASQIGAALENNRLIQKSLKRERMAKEMELAHNLQMKLLPSVDKFDGAHVAARVEPAEQVGGDFYQLFKLSEDRVGVMIGDVSSHGFPAALIMALSMSAASIYAWEYGSPAQVITQMAEALHDELETTEMYLTLFYGVLDRKKKSLVYSNAGHPHAFIVQCDGSRQRLAATDPPVGIAEGEFGQSEVRWDSEVDLLLLFTDGLSDTLTSATTGNGEEFVLDLVAQHRGETPKEIVEALFAKTRDVTPSVPSDDRTAIVLRA